ncbi:hypothetical protein A6C57_00270 [Fibrella sp. ES10-3-2-2]|nr:hypothetical protein A6C57_00270 [Fibrella sp. ES10-3-2-2]
MKNQALENFQRALAALVGLLTIDKPTPIDTSTFCGKHKMSAEHFFPALRQLDCVMLGPVQAKDKTSHILYLTRTNKLLSIDPDEVIAAVRRLSKTEKGEAIVWHSKAEEQQEFADKATLSESPATVMLTKALDQVPTLPASLVDTNSYEVALEEEHLADQPTPEPVEPTAEPVAPIPTLESILMPADQVARVTDPTVEATPDVIKRAAEFVDDIIKVFYEDPQKQLAMMQTMHAVFRQRQLEQAASFQKMAADFTERANQFSALAQAYEQCINR